MKDLKMNRIFCHYRIIIDTLKLKRAKCYSNSFDFVARSLHHRLITTIVRYFDDYGIINGTRFDHVTLTVAQRSRYKNERTTVIDLKEMLIDLF